MSSESTPTEAALPAGAVRRPVWRQDGAAVRAESDWIAEEVPAAIRCNGLDLAVMMLSPADLEDFALGFLLSEGIVVARGEVESIRVAARLECIEIDIRIDAARAEALRRDVRWLEGRSGCGLCGTRAIEDVLRPAAPLPARAPVPAAALRRALDALTAAQPVNALTGATHAAAFAAADGHLLCVREDVGRHNALDKLVGALVRQGLPVEAGFLVLTSRASFEMVQKAARCGIGVMVAISAPTALAIAQAEAAGMSLVGFARGAGHVIYTGAQGISASED